MAPTNLQNSYGPETYSSNDFPEVVPQDYPQRSVQDGLEPSQQHSSPLPLPYNEQHEKNRADNGSQSAAHPHPARDRMRILGLPVLAFWGVIVGLILVLAIGLGAGLGVGLSHEGASGTSAVTASTTVPAATTEAATTGSASTGSATTKTAKTTATTSTTTSSSSPAATARNVMICNDASLVSCKNLTVPVNTCIDFPSAYNDSVSSVDTGGPQCDFFTGDNCTGDDWSTNGTQYLIPGEYNDAFSSVACMVD